MIKPKCLIAAVVLTATMGSAHAVPVSGSFEGIITSVTDPYGLLVVLTGGHRSEGFPQYSGPHISGTFGYLTETLSPASCDVGYGSPCTFTATAPSGFQGSWQITGWGQSGTVVGDFFSKIMVTQEDRVSRPTSRVLSSELLAIAFRTWLATTSTYLCIEAPGAQTHSRLSRCRRMIRLSHSIGPLLFGGLQLLDFSAPAI